MKNPSFISRSAPSTPCTRHVRRVFGMIERNGRAEHAVRLREMRRLAARLDREVEPGRVAFITGASGAGKSMVLRALALRLRSPLRPRDISRPARRASSVIDVIARRLSGSMERRVGAAMTLLACAGLGEAAIATAPTATLSEGQSFRLALAMAMADAQSNPQRAGTLLVDEFCSTLDPLTAANICRTLHRWTAKTGIRAFIASARDELMDWLAPHVLVHLTLDGPTEVLHAA